METLTRHPAPEAPAPGADPPAPADAVDAAPEAVAERSCAACDAPMATGQDWCLECGTAAPGRLGRRPGWRAVGTTLALTLLLVGGAGAASYAALSSDATRDAAGAAPADGTPVAQAPPVVPAPAAPVIPPKVSLPSTELPSAPRVQTPARVLPTTPSIVVPRTSPTPKVPSSSKADDDPTPRGSGTPAGDTPSTPKALTPLAFDASALTLYDPYGRTAGSAGTDPARAHDGDAATAFVVGAPAGGGLQAGLVMDLGSAKQVRGLRLNATKGVAVEVYASDSSVLPPDILDTRWDHPASRVAASQTEELTFPRGGKRYRYVAVWFTKAPKDLAQVSVRELGLLH